MSSDIAISARGLSKTYRAYDHPLHRLLDRFAFGRSGRYREFHALRDVSFDIRRGETVGIVGRNGSGKSTLLQLICGIRKPTSGTVATQGRISALLELGAGFHPEFTGRENVFLQGAIQGFSREEVEQRFDDIAAFADIGEFIDQPVKTYSSGMFVRLAFAAAIHVEPDILIIDEALSVGDIGFQAKCLRKIADLQRAGVTILLVTHSTDQIVSHCSRGLLLDHGELLLDATAKASVFEFKRLITSGKSKNIDLPDAVEPPTASDAAPATHALERPFEGTGKARFIEIGVYDATGTSSETLFRNTEFTIRTRTRIIDNLSSPVVFFLLSDAKGASLCGTSSLAQGVDFGDVMAGSEIAVTFRQSMLLNAGEYFLSIGCQTIDGNGYVSHDLRWECLTIRVMADSPRPGVFDPQSTIRWAIKAPSATS